MDLISAQAGPGRLWEGRFQLSDWLDPTAPPDDPAAGLTDKDFVASAYFAWSASHLAMTAEILGRRDEAERYDSLAREVREALRGRYLDDEGYLKHESQTGYALLICLGLTDTHMRGATASRRLRELVEADGHHISTGFVGTPLISRALTISGSPETAHAQVLETEYPSWLYAVTQSATTIWERWDSLRPDGTVNPRSRRSYTVQPGDTVSSPTRVPLISTSYAPWADAYSRAFTMRPGSVDTFRTRGGRRSASVSSDQAGPTGTATQSAASRPRSTG